MRESRVEDLPVAKNMNREHAIIRWRERSLWKPLLEFGSSNVPRNLHSLVKVRLQGQREELDARCRDERPASRSASR